MRLLQQALIAAGVDAGAVDGKFGDRTVEAVRRFQKMVGLPTTGVATPETLDMLLRPASSGSAEVFLYRDPRYPKRRHLLSDYGPPPGPDRPPPRAT